MSSPDRDRRFQPMRKAACALAESVVAEVIGHVSEFEARHSMRQRRRKAKDQARFAQTVSAVVCDLMHRQATVSGGYVSVSLSNDKLGRANRHKAPALNTTLPKVLACLATNELQVIKLDKAPQWVGGAGRLTTIAAGPRLVAMMQARGIRANHLIDAGDAEVIELRGVKQRKGAKASAPVLDYEDTEQTRRWRAQMQDINAWLAGADIAFAGLDQDGRLVDTTERRLKRIFSNGRFDHGGRLYGGFWQGLSAERRLQALTIEGEPAAELDFSQCGPRILYGMAKLRPPADCYSIPGYEQHRVGFKKLLSALLIVGVEALQRYPQGLRELFEGSGLTAVEAKRLLLEHHVEIAQLIEPDTGHWLMFRESELLVDVLLRLKAAGIVALPIHDAVLVKASKASEALSVMRATFLDHTGQEGRVKVVGGGALRAA